MDQKLIKKLKDAGVDADIILGLILDEESGADPAPEQVTPKSEETPPEAKEEKPAAEAPARKTEPDPVLAKLDSLIGAIQASNIIRSARPFVEKESVDDILANMIMPGTDKEVK